MIKIEILGKGLDLLSKHFNRELLPAVIAMWQEYLSEELTEQEFASSVRNSILHCKFMPTAGELVEFVKGGKEAQAIADWQIVLKAAANSRERADEMLAYANPRVRVALQAIGGLGAIAVCETEFQRNHLQKQFVTVYCSNLSEERSLPQSAAAPKYKAPDDDFAPMPEDIKKQMEELKAKMDMRKKT